MAKLKDKIRTGLDEDRMLVLVVQVLIGFEFRGALEPGFDRLSPAFQHLKLGGAGLLLLTLALLLTVPSFHRLAEDGDNNTRVLRTVARLMSLALLPFAFALGTDLAAAARTVFGVAGGVTAGGVTVGMALFFWYGFGLIAPDKKQEDAMSEQEDGATSLADKIKQVLTEGRIVLPGAQALLGFQLSGFFTDAFEKLPRESQLLHLVALSLVAITAILLMTPPAYHRIVEKGEETERFHRVANRFVISAMIPLALGISVDFYVVVNKVTKVPVLSLIVSAAALAVFYGLWFGYPLLARRAKQPGLVISPAESS